jgi:RNA polymerase sigma factor (TIGR02999 family)
LSSRRDITNLLKALNAGKEGAEEQLLMKLYDELHALARYYMHDERTGHTLQTTALVHEAYIRMGGRKEEAFENKVHYMRVAAQAMRRVLIDYARRRQTQKEGGRWHREVLDKAEELSIDTSVNLPALDSALEKLAKMDKKLAQIVELRFFGGLTIEETAKVLGVSPRTVKYDWRMARAWLKEELKPD